MRRSTSASCFNQNKLNRLKSLKTYQTQKFYRNKSEVILNKNTFKDTNDIPYLKMNGTKSIPCIISKIPFISLKEITTNINLKKSHSCNSIHSYILNAPQKHYTNKMNFSNSIYTNDISFYFENKHKTNYSLHRSPSCFNLDSLFNNKHNLFFINGKVPCYTKILQKIDYNSHICIHRPINLSFLDTDLSYYFSRDERVNDREIDFILKNRKKITYFSRCRNKKKPNKKRRSDDEIKNENSKLLKDRPRFNLYFPTNSTPPPKKTQPIVHSPRLSPAFVLSDKYNIRTRVFKENSIRNFYKELEIAEDDDRRFVFPEIDQKTPKKKRNKSVLTRKIFLLVTLKKEKRAKSVQNSPNNKNLFESPSSTPKSQKNKPRFKLYSPRDLGLFESSTKKTPKKSVKDHQSPRLSSASVLNEKYNIRSRLFKEMNVQKFYQNLAEAEEDARLQITMKQIQMSSRSKKIAERYIQRQKNFESKNNNKKENAEKEKQSQSENESQSQSNISDTDRSESYNETDSGKEKFKNDQKSIHSKSDNKNDINEKESEKEESPPKIKKLAHKVPDFISGVSNFLKEYNIRIREDVVSTQQQQPKRKKV